MTGDARRLGRYVGLTALVIVALYVLGLLFIALLPQPLVCVLGVVSGAMPGDAHLLSISGPNVRLRPPGLLVDTTWHTCGRVGDSFEQGSFSLNLLTGRVTPWKPPPEGSPEWALALSCPATGTVEFDARVVDATDEDAGALPVLTVETSTDRGDVFVAVKLPMDTTFEDSSGRSLTRPQFFSALEEDAPLTLEVEDIGGTAWSVRIRLGER